MTMKKRPSRKKDVLVINAEPVYPDPYALTLRLSPEQSRLLLLTAAVQPDFARQLSHAIRAADFSRIQSLLRARGIRLN